MNDNNRSNKGGGINVPPSSSSSIPTLSSTQGNTRTGFHTSSSNACVDLTNMSANIGATNNSSRKNQRDEYSIAWNRVVRMSEIECEQNPVGKTYGCSAIKQHPGDLNSWAAVITISNQPNQVIGTFDSKIEAIRRSLCAALIMDNSISKTKTSNSTIGYGSGNLMTTFPTNKNHDSSGNNNRNMVNTTKTTNLLLSTGENHVLDSSSTQNQPLLQSPKLSLTLQQQQPKWKSQSLPSTLLPSNLQISQHQIVQIQKPMDTTNIPKLTTFVPNPLNPVNDQNNNLKASSSASIIMNHGSNGTTSSNNNLTRPPTTTNIRLPLGSYVNGNQPSLISKTTSGMKKTEPNSNTVTTSPAPTTIIASRDITLSRPQTSTPTVPHTNTNLSNTATVNHTKSNNENMPKQNTHLTFSNTATTNNTTINNHSVSNSTMTHNNTAPANNNSTPGSTMAQNTNKISTMTSLAPPFSTKTSTITPANAITIGRSTATKPDVSNTFNPTTTVVKPQSTITGLEAGNVSTKTTDHLNMGKSTDIGTSGGSTATTALETQALDTFSSGPNPNPCEMSDAKTRKVLDIFYSCHQAQRITGLHRHILAHACKNGGGVVGKYYFRCLDKTEFMRLVEKTKNEPNWRVLTRDAFSIHKYPNWKNICTTFSPSASPRKMSSKTVKGSAPQLLPHNLSQLTNSNSNYTTNTNNPNHLSSHSLYPKLPKRKHNLISNESTTVTTVPPAHTSLKKSDNRFDASLLLPLHPHKVTKRVKKYVELIDNETNEVLVCFRGNLDAGRALGIDRKKVGRACQSYGAPFEIKFRGYHLRYKKTGRPLTAYEYGKHEEDFMKLDETHEERIARWKRAFALDKLHPQMNSHINQPYAHFDDLIVHEPMKSRMGSEDSITHNTTYNNADSDAMVLNEDKITVIPDSNASGFGITTNPEEESTPTPSIDHEPSVDLNNNDDSSTPPTSHDLNTLPDNKSNMAPTIQRAIKSARKLPLTLTKAQPSTPKQISIQNQMQTQPRTQIQMPLQTLTQQKNVMTDSSITPAINTLSKIPKPIIPDPQVAETVDTKLAFNEIPVSHLIEEDDTKSALNTTTVTTVMHPSTPITVRKPSDRSEIDHLCVICQTDKVQIIFQPCHHRVLCPKCNNNGFCPKFCPICRTEIGYRLKTDLVTFVRPRIYSAYSFI